MCMPTGSKGTFTLNCQLHRLNFVATQKIVCLRGGLFNMDKSKIGLFRINKNLLHLGGSKPIGELEFTA